MTPVWVRLIFELAWVKFASPCSPEIKPPIHSPQVSQEALPSIGLLIIQDTMVLGWQLGSSEWGGRGKGGGGGVGSSRKRGKWLGVELLQCHLLELLHWETDSPCCPDCHPATLITHSGSPFIRPPPKSPPWSLPTAPPPRDCHLYQPKFSETEMGMGGLGGIRSCWASTGPRGGWTRHVGAAQAAGSLETGRVGSVLGLIGAAGQWFHLGGEGTDQGEVRQSKWCRGPLPLFPIQSILQLKTW